MAIDGDDQRIEAVATTSSTRALSLRRAAIGALAYATLAAVGLLVDRWFVWIAVWVVQAFVLLGVVATVHECVHNHFVRGRRANRTIGTIAAAIAFTPFEVYRAQHILHHADTCGPDDAEGEPYSFTRRWQIPVAFLAGGILWVASMTAAGLSVSFGRTPPWLTSATQRRRIRWNMVVWAGVVAAAVAWTVADPRLALSLWIVPVLVALAGPLPLVLIPEHYDAPGPGEVTSNTRTCVSNRFIRFVYLNTNLHTAHHSRPSIPWHDLPAQHERLEPDIEPGWLSSGYLAFHRDVWRSVGRAATGR